MSPCGSYRRKMLPYLTARQSHQDYLTMKKPGPQSSIRVIGGELRSRKIQFPELDGLRPSADRVRETLFNWLQLDIPGSRCLDLFSGSGVLGIESLSRGASSVTFIENNPVAARAVQDNLSQLGLTDGNVNCIDALRWLNKQSELDQKFDVVFLDPPFSEDIIPTVCELLEKKSLLSFGSKIYIETGTTEKPLSLPPNWRELKRKQAGQVDFRLLLKERPI